NEELELEFNVKLSSLLDAISNEKLQKENIDFEIGRRIIAYISEGDGYSWQRDTPTYLERYNCEGIVNIEIFSTWDLIKIIYSHKALHPQPRHVATTLEVKTFIKDNIEFPVSEIWCQIQENFIKGYENLTRLLEELNQEIIVDNLNSSTPALG
ncbi:24049_t:CDS:2, partial [Racocetra persica]